MYRQAAKQVDASFNDNLQLKFGLTRRLAKDNKRVKRIMNIIMMAVKELCQEYGLFSFLFFFLLRKSSVFHTIVWVILILSKLTISVCLPTHFKNWEIDLFFLEILVALSQKTPETMKGGLEVSTSSLI